MKRRHRRFHFLAWVVLAPITAVLGIWFWTQRTVEPFTDLPSSIKSVSDRQSESEE